MFVQSLAFIATLTTAALLLKDDMSIQLVIAISSSALIGAYILNNWRLAQAKAKNSQLDLSVSRAESEAARQQVRVLQEQFDAYKVAAAKPSIPATAPNEAEHAAVLLFVRMLQEKSRLLDFTLTDIARLPDNQVGAAARAVHQGLRSVFNETFEIKPIAAEAEGQSLQLPDDFDTSRYRLLQQSAEQIKFSGILLHRGWEALTVRLPQSTRKPGDALPRVLAPAEIESRELNS